MNRLLDIFKNLKFRNKLLISYFVVCIIPIVVLGTYSYFQANVFLKQQARQSLNESIRQIAENLNFNCRKYKNIANSVTYNFRFQQLFANNEVFPKMYLDYVDPFFYNILSYNKDILQISIFTDKNIERGEYIIPSKVAEGETWYENGTKSTQLQWYSKNGRVLCTQIFTKGSVSEAARPDLLFMSINTNLLFEEIDNINVPSFGVFVLDKNGVPILSGKNNLDFAPEIPDIIKASGARDSAVPMKGEDFLVFKAVINETGWELYYFTPASAISINATAIAGMTVIITLVCIAALIFVIIIFSNTFVKRIKHLNQKMEFVEKGNLNIDVSSPSRDEIGELTNRFGKMLGNLNERIREVYQSKITQREAELKALQAQINPHFLYNTLSIINWKAIQADEMEISEITNRVSLFYRTVLNKGRNVISIRNEVENARAYAYIQLIMHNNSFDFECDIDEAIYRYDIINLVLQPLVENAIEHGIDGMRKGSGRGRIVLTGNLSGEDVVLSVEDNGIGMPEDIRKDLLSMSTKGYGVKNVHDRIQYFFGEQYGLTVESRQGCGTRITVTVPRYTADS